MSLIESLARHRRELLARAHSAGSKPDPVAEGLVDASNRLVEAIAHLPPASDRDVVMQAALLAHLLNEHGGDEEPHGVPWHALARSVLSHLAARSGIADDEIATWFRDRPSNTKVAPITSRAMAADAAAQP